MLKGKAFWGELGNRVLLDVAQLALNSGLSLLSLLPLPLPPTFLELHVCHSASDKFLCSEKSHLLKNSSYTSFSLVTFQIILGSSYTKHLSFNLYFSANEYLCIYFFTLKFTF